ncbi:MAG: YdcF family protein [Bacillota bacterium]|nr:YdcF family protein [Bacillota bacterium]
MKQKKGVKKSLYVLYCIFIIGCFYIGILQYKISQCHLQPVPKKADYLIILGASVKGTEPSLVLKYRIKTAEIYLKKNKNTIAIASGGKGINERISEAESIRRELIKKGIPDQRIFLENRSTSTDENIKFSKRLIPYSEEKGIVVTNDFHMYRALMIAKDHGLNLYGLPAKTPLVAIPKSYIHEYLALTKYFVEKYCIW